jgi:hypothetical protein
MLDENFQFVAKITQCLKKGDGQQADGANARDVSLSCSPLCLLKKGGTQG